jgi:tripartite-type tricarboxylate transporter receptor subunit TctC
MKRVRRLLVLASIGLSLGHVTASAQEYPSRTINLIATISAGSATDAVGRFVATSLGKEWGTTVVVENKPAAGSLVGTEYVARAAPDGYTLLLTSTGHYSAPAVSGAPYDPVRDFVPIAALATSPVLVATRTNSPFKNLSDLLTAAKQRPGDLSYSHSGTGTTAHMGGALLETMAGIQFRDIPYKTTTQGPIDASSGEVDFVIASPPSSMSLIKAGRLRVLATSSLRRSALLPNVPTVEEAGVPGYQLSSPIWLFAPRGTPQPIVTKLSQAVTRIASSPEFKQFCLNLGIEADPQDTDTVKAAMVAENEKWKRLVELTKPKK